MKGGKGSLSRPSFLFCVVAGGNDSLFPSAAEQSLTLQVQFPEGKAWLLPVLRQVCYIDCHKLLGAEQ